MANVRQVPEMYLRGSLANITMPNLSLGEREHVSQITTYVANHQDMAKHRARVMREFGETIGADYRDDRTSAEQEFLIAIWRGVVDIFYHRKYTFRCLACNSSHFVTKRHKPKPIDRIQTPCPNCQQVRVLEAGDTELVIDSYMTHDAFQASYKHLTDKQKSPKCGSPIQSTAGAKKYDNPDQIIQDNRQLKKFFGEFVWNYFRQQIAENKRKEHHKSPQPIVGRADYIVVEELLSLCRRLDLDYNYSEKTEPFGGFFTIRVAGYLAPPEFSAEYVLLARKAAACGVDVEISGQQIRVRVTTDAPDLEGSVIKPEHVSVLDNCASLNEDGDGDFTIGQISYRTVRGARMDLDDHVAVVDTEDVLGAIRHSLPDGHCQDVFDILIQQGETYTEFSNRYGDSTPRINHIAEFLGVTTRAVNQHRNNIKIVSLANNIGHA